MAAREKDKQVVKRCGIVAGYIVNLSVNRVSEEGEIPESVGVHIQVYMRRLRNIETGPAGGVGFEVTITCPPNDIHTSGTIDHFFTIESPTSGWSDFIEKPWAEAVREGSPYFPGGKMEVKATLKLATKE